MLIVSEAKNADKIRRDPASKDTYATKVCGKVEKPRKERRDFPTFAQTRQLIIFLKRANPDIS